MSLRPCLICNLEIKTPNEFLEHMLSHVSLKLFNCPKCNRSYKYSRNRTAHMKINHKVFARLKNPITKMTVLSDKQPQSGIVTILINCDNSSATVVTRKQHNTGKETIDTKRQTETTKSPVDINQKLGEYNKSQSLSSSYICNIPSRKHIEDICSTSVWPFDPSNINLEVETFPDEQILTMEMLKNNKQYE